MHTDDSATAVHHVPEFGQILRGVGQAVRGKRVADEHDRGSGGADGRVFRPFVEEVHFHARDVGHAFQTVLQEASAGGDFVGAGRMVGWADDDENAPRLSGEG